MAAEDTLGKEHISDLVHSKLTITVYCAVYRCINESCCQVHLFSISYHIQWERHGTAIGVCVHRVGHCLELRDGKV